MTDVTGTASDYFASMIEDYDSLIRRAVPTYQQMLDTTLEYMPPHPRRGLELGCGTGNFTLALAGLLPECRWTTVDASDEMIELTAARVAEEATGVHVDCVLARFEEIEFDAGSFDLITSCISLHHVADKAELFARLRPMLRPGGSLRFSDQLTGAAPGVADRHWERWLEHCRAPEQCTEAEVDHLVEHSEAHDHYESLAAYAQYLRDAGFVGIDCVWRDGMWAIVTAEAPLA
ncbi:MAG: methyltransferase domain-containing protein [Gemmatimonadota bacterium]|nr:methyltransferase domain-containing protein [Gemmatimonadota bacterium]